VPISSHSTCSSRSGARCAIIVMPKACH
jgi:hypothetical protein